MPRTLLILIAILLPGATALAQDAQAPHEPTTYYVSTAGSDDNPGNAANPWRTLQHTVPRVRAGDTVIVRAGNYEGFVMGWDDPQLGRQGAPITFRAEKGAVIVDRNAKTRDGIDMEPGNAWIVIDGFAVDGSGGKIARAGIRVTGSDHVSVVNNVCRDCGDWGIFTSHSNDLLIENNLASGSKRQHGIYVSNSADHAVVRGNRMFGNFCCGLHMNGDASQGGNGLITHALVENNIIYDNGKNGGSAINCDGLEDSIIRDNLLYNNHASGISLFREDGADGSKGNTIVNNTIVMADDARWAVNIKNGSTNNTVCNNILFNANPSRGSIQVSADSSTGFVSDHNVVEDRFSVDDEPAVGLSRWQEETGSEKHSVLSAPAQVFVNPDKQDFHLLASSPARHEGLAGDALPSVGPRDLDGKNVDTKSDAPVDAGAYQSTSP